MYKVRCMCCGEYEGEILFEDQSKLHKDGRKLVLSFDCILT